jgi:hypothetical protein
MISMSKGPNTKQRLPNTKGELDRREWCFDTVPKHELEPCFDHEYSREFARQYPKRLALFSESEAGWHAPNGECVDKASWKKVNTFFPLEFGFGNWVPDTPWQALDEQVRRILTRNMHDRLASFKPSLYMETALEWKAMNANASDIFDALATMCAMRSTHAEFGGFIIDWSCSDSAIKRAFGEWLAKQRQSKTKQAFVKIKRTAKARGGLRDQLNWLGALRIVNHYPKKQLVDYGDTNLKVDAPYSHLPDLYKAAKRARKLVESKNSTTIVVPDW